MRKGRSAALALVALVAALAFSALAAQAAFASVESPEWLVNGSALSGTVKAGGTGTVVLNDLNAKVKLKCSGETKGIAETAEGFPLFLVEKATATTCKVEEGTCPSPSAEAVGLPWNLLLKYWPLIKLWYFVFMSKSGWKVTCAGIIKDTCTAEEGAPEEGSKGGPLLEVTKLEDPLSNPELEFPAAENENKATCSLSNKKVGDVAGTVNTSSEEAGKTLEIS